MSEQTPDRPENQVTDVSTQISQPQENLSAAAQRALAEAADRRKALEEAEAARPKELGGRDGLDPARYGDWERKGIAVDF